MPAALMRCQNWADSVLMKVPFDSDQTGEGGFGKPIDASRCADW